MLISFNWLKQYIDTPLDAHETEEVLTDLGLEVEGVTEFSSVKGGLAGIVVGHVVECLPHPNADRLKLTKVDVGQDHLLQIVCGAPNVAQGQKVPVATIGTTLYDADGKPWEIKKGKIRGEHSEGMICSEKELGLGEGEDGIMILDAALAPGTPAATVFEVENDHVFEIGLTPNRSDAMSHWGVARDLKAGLLQKGINAKLITPSTSSFRVESRTLKVKVKVEDNNLAPRYCGVTISGVKVQPSPQWLQNRIKAIGLSPINNIVDVTNFVLHDLGQPLHAFDAHKITENEIHVKTLPAGTKFKTLDGVERTLHEEDLMICDTSKPLALAGVFGGMDSGVSEDTTNIFIESAYFDPISIRKSAKRHGLSTDASFRYERGVDPNITDYALRYAAILIMQVAGGTITSDLIDIYPKKIEEAQVFLQFEKAAKLIGQHIPKETIKDILTSLEMKINSMTESGIGMSVPAYRHDVKRDVDVIEEVLRVYGYNNINFSEKLNASTARVLPGEDYKIQNIVAQQLTALGFVEMMNNSLTTPKYLKLATSIPKDNTVPILNPLSQDLSVMRQTLLFSGLEVVEYNSNRNYKNLLLFEFGKTYSKQAEKYIEEKHLSLFITGNRATETWTLNTKKSDFFFGKGVIINILERLGLDDVTESLTSSDFFSEGLTFSRQGEELVQFGIVQKKIAAAFDVSNEVFYADFAWDLILKQLNHSNFTVQSIPKFPKSERDFALLLDEGIKFSDLKEAALDTEKKLLKTVELFDVYTGKNLPQGKKSYALKFTFQDAQKTLTDKQVDKVMEKLRQKFEKQFGAALR